MKVVRTKVGAGFAARSEWGKNRGIRGDSKVSGLSKRKESHHVQTWEDSGKKRFGTG